MLQDGLKKEEKKE
jgi:hypothetical protein